MMAPRHQTVTTSIGWVPIETASTIDVVVRGSFPSPHWPELQLTMGANVGPLLHIQGPVEWSDGQVDGS